MVYKVLYFFDGFYCFFCSQKVTGQQVGRILSYPVLAAAWGIELNLMELEEIVPPPPKSS